MKKQDYRASVVEFVTTLSDEELRFVATRLSDRYTGDMAEALTYLSGKPVVDVILGSAVNADEFFDYCDGIREVAYKEIKRRAATLVSGGEFDPRQKHQGERPPRQFHDATRQPRQHSGGGYQGNNGSGGDRAYKSYQKRVPNQPQS
jgi:hypothetical protein